MKGYKTSWLNIILPNGQVVFGYRTRNGRLRDVNHLDVSEGTVQGPVSRKDAKWCDENLRNQCGE